MGETIDLSTLMIAAHPESDDFMKMYALHLAVGI